MVTTRGLPRRDRDPPRHARTTCGTPTRTSSPPYIRRRDRFEVTERIDTAARSSTPLDEDEARELAAHPAPARRRDGRGLLRQRLRQPGATSGGCARSSRRSCPTSPSRPRSETLPEIFEHERFSTTVANAVLAPLVAGYVSRLEQPAEGRRLRRRPAAAALRRRRDDARDGRSSFAVRLAASGIAAGAIAAPPHRRAVRLRERDRPRHGRHEHRHLARLRRRAAHDQRVGASSTATRSASRPSRC